MSRLLIGCLAIGLTLTAEHASAGSAGGTVAALLGAQLASQSAAPSDGGEESRRQVMDLLSRARQAMEEGNLETAESLISRAEALSAGQSSGMGRLFHLGDTPAKARKDLDRLREANSGGSRLPSQMFNAGSAPPPGADPFAGRDSMGTMSPTVPPATNPVPPPMAELTPPTMSAQSPFPSQAPFGRAPMGDAPPATDPMGANLVQRISYDAPAADDARMQSDQSLMAARKALALGDVRRATEMVEQAKRLQVRYDHFDDTPLKVEAAIQTYSELTSRPAVEQSTDGHRRRMADHYLQQAEALLRWREYDEAERLVGEANRQNANYGPWDTKPEAVLTRIVEARNKGGATASIKRLPPVGADQAGADIQMTRQVDYQSPGGGLPTGAANAGDAKSHVLDLVAQARGALQSGDVDRAEALARQAEGMGVREDEMGPQDDRPWLVLLEVEKARRRTAGPVQQASGAMAPGPNGAPVGTPFPGNQALYDPNNDPTRNIPASAQQPIAAQPPQGGAPQGEAINLLHQGEAALRQRDYGAASALFQQALAYQDELDDSSRQRLKDRLMLVSQQSAIERANAQPGSLMEEQIKSQQLLARQISSEVARKESEARRVQENDPEQAHALLEQARQMVERSTLEPSARDALLRRVDRDLEELEAFVLANKPRIDLARRNQAILDDIDRNEKHKVEVQEKLALLVNEFNQLMDEQQWMQAEQVARRAGELAPDELVVLQMKQQSKFVRMLRSNMSIRDEKERNVAASMLDVDRSSIPMDPEKGPLQFGDLKNWQLITDRRKMREAMGQRQRSERELEIMQKLKTPVSLKFQQAPLSQVMDYLAKVTQVNMHLDESGLAQEGVATDTPVTIDLSQEISLKSALNLILEPLHLSYVVQNEVLKITSEQLRDGAVYPVTYHVADLVLPIPNFVPSSRMGLAGAIHDAHATVGVNNGSSLGGVGSLAVLAGQPGAGGGSTMIDPRVLGQFNNLPMGAGLGSGGPPSSGMGQNIPFGPGGMGGGVEPDFDSLIQLITNTVEPTTWSEVGGAGSVEKFPTNLSLVISQTQEVHEQVADLLNQLRRLQDLQVTIEVRFITLNDNFFEQIGIDFDFEINDNADRPFQVFGRPDTSVSTPFTPVTPIEPGVSGFNVGSNNPARNVQDRDLRRNNSATVGMSAPGVFSADLDIPFTQTSFNSVSGLTTGTLGAGIAGGASLGFAILSDLEAYFFMRAVQQDVRTNVLQAPKVTLFNGQQAFVSDTSQSPFVVSVIPVVGDFAAAQQPVIVVLSEGTFLNVQAVVSSDRRFVRLTVVPFFSQIGQVNTFTFEGSETTTRSRSETNDDGPDNSGEEEQETTTRQGTTVQLPTFAFTTVTTTVSVPDGGTVLLGGLKQMSEERRENGVPMLNKIPYLNRLFNNVATGKSSRSLMMMVTPRIIIQEEEEFLLGVQPSP